MPLTKIDDRGLTTPVDLQDSEKLRFGTGNDFEVYHDGTNSLTFFDAQVGGVRFRTDIGNSARSNLILGAGVDLYYNNVKKFETISTGVQVTGDISHLAGTYTNASGGHVKIKHDSGKLFLGAGEDLELLHNGSQSEINSITGGLAIKDTGGFMRIRSNELKIQSTANENYIECDANGAVQLFYDNSNKFETTNYGNHFNGNLRGDDGSYIQLGSGQDFQLSHNGTNSFITNSTGELQFQANDVRFYTSGASETHAKFIHNGAVELYYDNSRKLRTYSGGVIISSDSGHGRLVFTDTDGNYCFQFAGYDEVSYGDGGGGVFQDADGAVVLDMRKSGTNIHCHNNIKMNGGGNDDNLKLNLGASDDLQLYHDGTNSQIRNSTGVLQIGGSSNASLGCTRHGDTLFYMNDKGWSTTTYLSGHSHRHIRRHVHRLEHGQNNVATFDLLRYRKYWWGWGHIEIRLHANYYYGSQTVVGYLHGYSTGGTTNYAIRTLDQVYVNGNDHRPGGWSINLRTPSSSSPGSTDCNYVDVYAQIPNYTYGTVEVIAMSDYNESATSASMSTNSYTLFDF